MAVRRKWRCRGENPALHVLVAVLHAAGAIELLVPHPRTDSGQGRAKFEGGTGRVGIDRAVHERIGSVTRELFPIGLGNGGNELIRIERRDRGHREDLAVVGIKYDCGTATNDAHRFLHDLLDAGVDGEENLGSLFGLDARGFAINHTACIALKETRAGSPFQDIVEGLLDLRLPLDVGLVKAELRRLILVDVLGHSDITEKMGRQCTVDIVADRLERHRDPWEIQVVLAEAGHRLEIKILSIDERHLGVVAEVDLQLPGVVIAGEAEFFQVGYDRLIDDLDDVGFLLESPHAVVQSPVLALRHRTMLLLPGTDDIGKIELHLHAGAILDQGNPVAITDLTADRGQPDRELRMTLDAGLVRISLDDLDIPHPPQQQQHGGTDQDRQHGDLGCGFIVTSHGVNGTVPWVSLPPVPHRRQREQDCVAGYRGEARAGPRRLMELQFSAGRSGRREIRPA